ncbi:hypothetical protein LWM68_11075 [Niabella sp. W65]|nr:hypothetical protein [Niabella sp. W65]MCH7363254.1 hypothetical protein [Niabella sp. W65]
MLKALDDEQLKAYIVKKNGDRRIFYERARVRIDDRNARLEDFIKPIFEQTAEED